MKKLETSKEMPKERRDAALATECVARHPAAYKHLSPRLQCRVVESDLDCLEGDVSAAAFEEAAQGCPC